jgi:hypothetical protein
MNNIRLNKPFFSNKNYIIYLDSENKFLFKNKREANDFLTKLNRQVDESVLLITEKLNSLEELYRLYLLADKDYKFRFEINNSIGFITNRLDWMSDHSGSQNHDAIVYQGILGCFSALISSYNLIAEKAAKRNDVITKRRCALKIDLIILFREKLLAKDIKQNREYFKIKKAK